MQRLLKGNHRSGTVHTLLKDHTIEGIQARQEFLKESIECVVDE